MIELDAFGYEMLNTVVITVSDKSWQGLREDRSSQVIKDFLAPLEHNIVGCDVVPDEKEDIAGRIAGWADKGNIDLILTSGGTGLAQRDVTPEATLSILNKTVPGIGEIMRAETFRITKSAVLSRSVAGVRGSCLIVNLPGSPKAVRECLEVIMPFIPHAVEIIRGEVTEHNTPDRE